MSVRTTWLLLIAAVSATDHLQAVDIVCNSTVPSFTCIPQTSPESTFYQCTRSWELVLLFWSNWGRCAGRRSVFPFSTSAVLCFFLKSPFLPLPSWNVKCPAGCASQVKLLYGSNPYTGDSHICQACQHAGIIPASGGSCSFAKQGLIKGFSASSANGLTSEAFGSYPTSYTVAQPLAATKSPTFYPTPEFISVHVLF